jgi:NADPH-dependent 2,4-dienoyl-CoA reductase/sulfur reductase-like enzyme
VTERLVVIGGDAAGMSAASQARRLRGPDDLEIVAFERGAFTSYAACGIPYWIAGMIGERDRLVARAPEVFRQKQHIDVRTGHEVVAIDPEGRQVTVRGPDGEVAEHGYDQLLVATGASPLRPPIPGIDADGVFGVQTLDHGQAVLDALAERAPRRAVVIGAGYIGIEMAEAMKLRGLEVHVVEMAGHPMPTALEPDLGARVAEAMQDMGIQLHLGVPVEGIETDADGWIRAVVTPDDTVETDLAVLGTGTRPFSDLARDAGVPVGPSGGIVTDRQQRTPVSGVWAAGDCAETYHRVSKRPVSIALGTIANKQGRIAGLNLGGSYGTFPGVLGTAVTKVCQVEIARTGLGQRAAEEAGFEVVTATIDATTRAHYYPDAKPIAVKVIAERFSGRLLGAQIVGEEGAAKRIDVFATALWNEMTVDDLLNVDLSYAPPFSPVWDPVLIAARKADGAVAADRAAGSA